MVDQRDQQYPDNHVTLTKECFRSFFYQDYLLPASFHDNYMPNNIAIIL